METADKGEEVSVTLHDLAVDWVRRITKGVITHKGVGHGKKVYSVETFEPDVVANRSGVPSRHIWHEVEVVPLKRGKLETYKQYKQRKTLWLVLPKDATKVFTVKLIEQCEGGKFKLVPWTGRSL